MPLLQLGDSDQSVQYSPSQLADGSCAFPQIQQHKHCLGKWWEVAIPGSFKGSVKTTNGPKTQLTLTFQGSAITVVGVTSPQGGLALVTIDQEAAAATANFTSETQQVNQVVFTREGLDSSVPHTLRLQYHEWDKSAGVIMVDSFNITVPAASPSPPSSLTTIPSPSGAEVPSRSTEHSTSFAAPDQSSTSSASATLGSSGSSSSVIPIVAGLATGLVTLLVACLILFFIIRRRRRAVPIQSVTPPPRTSPTRTRRQSRNLGSLVAYAFTRHGSSVTSSSDAHPPREPTVAPPIPQMTQYVSPYHYHRPRIYPPSVDSSLGPPVDERPPNVPRPALPASPIRTVPRILRVYNPDARSAISSNTGSS